MLLPNKGADWRGIPPPHHLGLEIHTIASHNCDSWTLIVHPIEPPTHTIVDYDEFALYNFGEIDVQ